MKTFAVCGLGNALVDLLVDIPDADFHALHFEPGTMRLVDHADQTALLDKVHRDGVRLASGGSVANSVIALSQLGGKAAFVGCVGDDQFGQFYQSEFTGLGIELGNPPLPGEPTGTCVCLITPDAERTMRTCLGVSSQLAARHVSEAFIRASEWLFVEGYVFANPDTGQHAVRRAVDLAKLHNTKIALTASEAFIPAAFGDAFGDALAAADLLFCNGVEACAVTGAGTASAAFDRLQSVVPNAVVTDGPARGFRPVRRNRDARPGVPMHPGGFDRGGRHVRRRVPVRHHHRRPGPGRGAGGEFSVYQGHHPSRGTAAHGHPCGVGRGDAGGVVKPGVTPQAILRHPSGVVTETHTRPLQPQRGAGELPGV